MEIAQALIKLGVPMAVISWLIFSWLYREGMLDIDADRKTTSTELKEIHKSYKQDKNKKRNYLHGKWMWFGSGFYGLAALWTFIVVEFLDLINFVFSFPGFTKLLENGFVDFIIKTILNQVGNIVSAFVWFQYWSEDSILTWFIVAYAGYMVGIYVAKNTHKTNTS